MEPSVLHVTQTTHHGVRRCVLDLVAHQVARGWQVTVASPETDDLPADVRAAGGVHVLWPARRAPGLSTVREVRSLRRIIGDLCPTLVHLHSSKAGLVGRLALRGRRPTVFQPNGWSFLAVDGLPRRAAIAWERHASRWTTALVCVSEHERADAVAAGIDAPWRVVPNAVDLSRFDGSDRAGARSMLGIPDAPVVVCVARLWKQKGQDILLSAWPRVRDAVPDARLVFVGTGPDLTALKRQAGGREEVQFTGARHDVPPWLAAADVVALPSRWEGMSYVMLEAMASGRSVVATDVGGAREAIGEADGRSAGALVRPENPAELAEALVVRLRDHNLAISEGREGLRRARELHDLRDWCERMHTIAVEVMATGVARTVQA